MKQSLIASRRQVLGKKLSHVSIRWIDRVSVTARVGLDGFAIVEFPFNTIVSKLARRVGGNVSIVVPSLHLLRTEPQSERWPDSGHWFQREPHWSPLRGRPSLG
jgi:hypothetical protein